MERREAFWRRIAKVDPDRLVFIDESGCNVAMTPPRAWAASGERAEAYRPMNWGKNVTLIGAVRRRGVVALRSMEGAMKTDDFLHFVASALVPKLQRGDVVVLDNLKQHRDPLVGLMIRNAGARLIYQPPYSPEVNPIELYWSAFKSKLRRFEARTTETLFAAIERTRRRRIRLKHFFAHCGYA